MKFRLHYIYLLWSVLMLGFAPMAFAQSESDFPPIPNPPKLVNDFAGVLSTQEREDLERALVAYDDSTSSQVSIVTLKSVGQYDIADYSFKLGEKWGIGQKGKNNGVLILAAIDDRKIWIATGYGLEGALPDALVGRIIRNEITPFFRSGNYYQGFLNGTQAIVKAAAGEYKAGPKDHEDSVSFIPILVLLIIFVVIIIAASKGGGGGKGGRYISRRGTDIFTGGMIGGGFGGFGGSGGFGGGSSGGGFGGFGGGSFGGGGAGGSW